MKQIYLLFLLIASFSFSQEAYYTNGQNNLNFTLTGEQLKMALSTKISNNIAFLPYSSSFYDTWDALKVADEDSGNTSNVILIYNSASIPKANTLGNGNTGQQDWNREHVFARSRAFPSLETNSPGPGTDINNLRPANPNINSDRGSLKFIDGSGSYGVTGSGWYPGDEWKGDVARMVMYMYLRYDGDGSSILETHCLPSNIGIGNQTYATDDMIDLFIEWNAEDMVSDLEIQRNDESELRQGNRNPFIDNPALATAIWGGPAAEDRWGNILSTNSFQEQEIKIYPNPAKGNHIEISSNKELSVEIYDILGKRVKQQNITSNQKTINISSLKKGVYLLRLKSDSGTITKKLIRQ